LLRHYRVLRRSILSDGYVLCIKINSAGDTLWSKKIKIGTSAAGLSVHQANDSGYIITGYSLQTPGIYTLMTVIKLNKYGVVSWSKTFSAGIITIMPILQKQTSDGGFIVSGETESATPNYPNAVLFKLTSDGIVSWSLKNNVAAQQTSTGGDIIVENNGFIWSLYPYYIVKTDFSGNVIWSKNYSFAQFDDPTLPVPTLTKVSDGGYLILYGMNMYQANLVKSIPLAFLCGTGINTDYPGCYRISRSWIIALGNGPIFGVIMADIMNPQIGIIKMDSVGNSVSCVFENWTGVYNDTVLMVPVTMVSTNAGIETFLNQTITVPAITSINSCITVTGKVLEMNKMIIP